jgi:hypothetical protein
MTSLPALPFSGLQGWTFVQRNADAQATRLQDGAAARRDATYFRDRIGSIGSAEDLVADRRLLRIALTAFGLDGDTQNRAFIRKVLESKTLDPQSLANRLADKQYLKLATAFGFGDFSTPRSKLSDFPDKILSQLKARQYETAVGAQNGSYRLALNAARELPEIAASRLSAEGKWFTILGNRPLRQVFETVLRLPASVGTLDIDRQLDIFQTRSEALLGTDDPADFADPATRDGLIRRYVLAADSGGAGGPLPSTRAATALQLLQTGGFFARL